jgi:hypothetical protein
MRQPGWKGTKPQICHYISATKETTLPRRPEEESSPSRITDAGDTGSYFYNPTKLMNAKFLFDRGENFL